MNARSKPDPAFPSLAQARLHGQLAEQVYRAVHERIAAGQLDPAERLTEAQLAAMLGVSRTPVREALVRLRREGLVASASIGTQKAGQPTRADIEEIMELRLLLEPHAAGRAAERADASGLADLHAALLREQAAAKAASSLQFAVANHDFRVLVLRLAGNSRLTETANRYESQIQALRRLSLKSRANRRLVLERHEAIVQAIARGDSVAAEQAMRSLLSDARRAMLALPILKAHRPPEIHS